MSYEFGTYIYTYSSTKTVLNMQFIQQEHFKNFDIDKFFSLVTEYNYELSFALEL